MLKKTTNLLFVSILLLAACSGSKTIKIKEDFNLRLVHQGCRGYCPDYNYTVDKDGNARYQGRKSVEMMGTYKKVLEKKQMAQIVEAFTKANFWDFEKEYGGGVADLPTVITSFAYDGKRHTVTNIREAPEALTDLEKKIEEIIGKEGWTLQDEAER